MLSNRTENRLELDIIKKNLDSTKTVPQCVVQTREHKNKAKLNQKLNFPLFTQFPYFKNFADISQRPQFRSEIDF